MSADGWEMQAPGLYFREDESGTVCGYFLRDGLPLGVDGNPSPRLASGWRAFERVGVRWWWRIDGAEEEWRPAGTTLERSLRHVEEHAAAVEASVTDSEPWRCAVCESMARAVAREVAA